MCVCAFVDWAWWDRSVLIIGGLRMVGKLFNVRESRREALDLLELLVGGKGGCFVSHCL